MIIWQAGQRMIIMIMIWKGHLIKRENMEFGWKSVEFANWPASLSRRVQLLPKPNPEQLGFWRLANKREVNDQSCHNFIICKCQMYFLWNTLIFQTFVSDNVNASQVQTQQRQQWDSWRSRQQCCRWGCHHRPWGKKNLFYKTIKKKCLSTFHKLQHFRVESAQKRKASSRRGGRWICSLYRWDGGGRWW